jgi:hypothetical protein
MIPALYKTEIQGLLDQLQPLSNFNHEASEIYMAGLGLVATVNAADQHDESMKPDEVEAIIHELKRFEGDAEVFLKDIMHFNH